jgi:hypothetical protein
METLFDSGKSLIASFFVVDSIWSVVFRAVIWFAIALVIIASTDVARPETVSRSVRANLGFFLMFLTLSGGLLYLLFGWTATPA